MHRSLTQPCITDKGSKNLGLAIERTRSLRNNSRIYFVENRVERDTWPANSRANSRADWNARITGFLLNVRIDRGTQRCISSTGRDCSCSVANINCYINIQLMQKLICYSAGDPSSIPGSEDPLEKGMATHSSILAWRIPWTEEPDGLSWGHKSQT